jgi:diguanylate cyclase (GGDEF)-like protein
MTDSDFLREIAGIVPAAAAEQLGEIALTLERMCVDVTGAVSRTAGEEIVSRLERELTRATHGPVEDADVEFAVLFLDLDGLKPVNDTQGHAAGDDLLHRAASALTSMAARPTDYIIRWGGDEFLAICKTVGYPQSPEDLGALMRDKFRVGLEVAGVNTSIGYSYTTHEVSLKDAIAAADKAMYADKNIRKTGTIADALTGEEITEC